MLTSNTSCCYYCKEAIDLLEKWCEEIEDIHEMKQKLSNLIERYRSV